MAKLKAPPTVSILPTLMPFPENLRLLQERLEGMGFMIAYASGLSYEPGLVFVPLASNADLAVVAKDIERVRAKFPNTVFAGIHAGRLGFKLTDAYRSGLSSMYAMPLEEDLLINKVYELVPHEAADEPSELSFDQLTRVSIGDLAGAKTLTFNLYLYLPMNQKIILYVEKDRPIEDKVIRKFKENPQYALYIRRSDLSKYFDFCRALLRSDDQTLTPAEASQQVAIRLAGLMGGFFNDANIGEEESKLMLENLKNLVSQLPDASGEKQDLVKAVGHLVSQQMSHLTHAQNVAAYSCLFGLALGQTEPETLRIGGLLHDLGLSDLPNELIGLDLEDMTEEQAAKYKLHPGGGKISIENKKIAVPPAVLDMVLFHHERPDGSGYPYGKKSAETPLIAKICAFADEFDKLTSVRPGHRQLSPREAMRRLAGLDGKPAMPIYEEAVHRKLLELFLDAEALKPSEPGAPPLYSGPRTKIGDLLKNPRFAMKVNARPEPSKDALADAVLASLKDLQEDLQEHWQAFKAG